MRVVFSYKLGFSNRGMKNLDYLETNQSIKLFLKVHFYAMVKTGVFEHHKAGGTERKYKNKWVLQLAFFF